MITALNDNNELQFREIINKDILGVRIETAYNCYLNLDANIEFYLIDNTAALMVRQNTAYLSGNVLNIEELAAFYSFKGITIVEGGECPDGFSAQEVVIMENEDSNVNEEEVFYDTDKEPDLWQLSLEDFMEIPSCEWYPESCLRRRRCGAKIYAIKSCDKYIATAGAYNLNKDTAVISVVATKEEYRKKGYAAALVKTLTQDLMPRKIYLICKKDMVLFYKKINYKITGDFCVFYKDEQGS